METRQLSERKERMTEITPDNKVPLAERTRGALRELVPLVETLTSAYTSLSVSDRDQAGQIADLTRRHEEAERRAQASEQIASEMKEKAARGEAMEKSIVRLIEALNDLPTKMEEAHMVPGATKPEILLYGTYEWRAVVDSKFFVEEALKEKRVL